MRDEYLFFDRRVNGGGRSVVDAGNNPTNEGRGEGDNEVSGTRVSRLIHNVPTLAAFLRSRLGST